MADADVAILLRTKDQASAGLKKAAQDAQKSAEKTSTATERAAAKAAAAAERGANMQRSSFQRLSRARETLGIRSEQSIQREVQRTRDAYDQLKASGTLSWREQGRAADQMRQKVTQLTNEMGRLTKMQKAMGTLKVGGAIAAGGAAAAYALKDPVERAMDWDYRLSHMANTAFAERDAQGKEIGVKEMEDAINNAVLQSGGTREGAADALDTMIKKGAVSISEAMRLLPMIVKAATSAKSSADDIAMITNAGLMNFGFTPDEIPNMLNMAVAGGKAGGFELEQMSKYLPTQLALAAQNGLRGREDFAAIIALNQAADTTAGNPDEAGNNVVNLLRKINSSDTAKDVKAATGINLSKYLINARENGMDSISAFGKLITEASQKNPEYKRLQKKLAEAEGDDEKRDALQSMSRIALGTGIGKFVQDQQAMMALLGMISDPVRLEEIKQKIKANDVAQGGAIDDDFDFLKNRPGYKANLAREVASMKEQDMLNNLTPAIGSAAEAFVKLAAEHGSLVGATSLAVSALSSLAGVAGVAAMAIGGGKIAKQGWRALRSRVLGAGATGVAGGVTAAGALGVAGTVGTAGAAAGALGTAGRVARLGGKAVRFAKGAAPIAIAGMAGEYALEKTFGEDSDVTRYGSTAISMGSTGAMIGSMIAPGIGTAIGAALGGVGGLLWEYFSSDKAKDAIEEQVKAQGQGQDQAASQDVGIVETKLTVTLDPQLRLSSQSTSVSGNVRNTGNVLADAPS